MDILAALDAAAAASSSSDAHQAAINAPAEMLDFGHVDACADLKELGWILGTLRRGVHGRYPDVRRRVCVCVCILRDCWVGGWCWILGLGSISGGHRMLPRVIFSHTP